jgi:uncharacterized protein YgiM (DUF1202 family)
MSDWRKWIRVILGLAVAALVFFVFMGIVGNYRTAKEEQRLTQSSKPTTTPPSTVTKTGRVPLTTPTAGSGTGTGTAAAKNKSVVVLVTGVNLRTGPSTTDDVIRGLKKGEQLAYLSMKNGYYQVRDDAGVKGWVSAKKGYTKIVSAK